MAHQCRPPTLTRRLIDLNQNRAEEDDTVSALDTAPDPESSVSDCESGVSGGSGGGGGGGGGGSRKPSPPTFCSLEQNMVTLSEGDKVYDLIKRRFISGLGSLGEQTSVESIQRHCYGSVGARARAQAYQIYLQAMEQKCGGNANMKFAWCATSKEEVSKILSYGFGHSGKPENNGLYGCGVYFSPDDHPLESVKLAPIDKHGLRHLLLCRVIMGKSEQVHPGSDQSHPNSEEFDSGVDDLSSPRKYIVWSTHMNTHVLPEYIISFRAPCCLKGFLKTQSPLRRPTSPWMPFPILISELSRILPPNSIRLITKYHKDHKERRISRQDLIQKVRQAAGDKLLISVIKSFRAKHLGAFNGLQEKGTEKGFDLQEKGMEKGFDNSVGFR